MFTQQDVETARRFEYKETKMSIFIAAAKICHRSQPKKCEEPHHITGVMKPLKLNV